MKPKAFFMLATFWMALMFFGSSIPSLSTTEITKTFLDTLNAIIAQLPGWLKRNIPISADSYSCFAMVIRKLGHFFSYQVLAVLLFKLFVNIKNNKHPYIITGLVAISFAFLDELYQSTVPDRSPLLLDILIDTAGVITALLIVRISRTKGV